MVEKQVINDAYLVGILEDIQDHLNQDFVYSEASGLENAIESLEPFVDTDKGFKDTAKRLVQYAMRMVQNKKRIRLFKDPNKFFEYIESCVENLENIDDKKLESDFRIYKSYGRGELVEYFFRELFCYSRELSVHKKTKEAKEQQDKIKEQLETVKENPHYVPNQKTTFFKFQDTEQARKFAACNIDDLFSRRNDWSAEEREIVSSLLAGWYFNKGLKSEDTPLYEDLKAALIPPAKQETLEPESDPQGNQKYRQLNLFD